ncbi:PerC family transcriptional regulator [Erwinia papayae]|uniref:PerC family transcriptional regulator n=1 Tax=Erwinia papayae TaxID=206499 RepID=A0ABV3MYD3_9GAMM
MELRDTLAECLEKKGQWRRAARRWLAVMDKTTDDGHREAIALRRAHCIDMAANVPPDGRRAEHRRCGQMQSRVNREY